MRPGRRRGAILLALAVLAVSAMRVAGGTPDPAPMVTTADGLTVLHSVDGVLAATLTAAPQRVRVGDLALDAMAFNGDYAGPVLRVRPGDTLRLRLVNRLTQPTNLHFHGMHSSPLGNGDNVHIAVPAGESFDYELAVPPDQPPGLYWYHSHLHGVSARQVMGGLSGALVVEGLEAQFPQLAGIDEHLFVLKDMTFDDDTGDGRIDDELHGLVQSINGALRTDLAMRPGETQLWRFTNQSANLYAHVALAGHRFRVIAEDGEAATRETTATVLDIKPASRIEVLVDAGAAGDYALLSRGAPSGASPDRELGHLVVAGAPAATVPPLAGFPAVPDLRGAHIDTARLVVFTQTTARTPAAQRFFINGRLFDPTRIDVRVPLGNVEEWTVRNDSDDMHVFHIHQLGFQVVEVNGQPVPFAGRIDTVRVPERGEVKLRMAFTDPLIVGRFMFHCHVLRHEDQGMMAHIEVYDPRASDTLHGVGRFAWRVWRWLCGVPWRYCGDHAIA
jgi:FtsP/CotA-like multicopper oxidase with cupredoxin domain